MTGMSRGRIYSISSKPSTPGSMMSQKDQVKTFCLKEVCRREAVIDAGAGIARLVQA
jgi:hypothetical protein